MMKCITIIGARPQFIKAAPVSVEMASAGIDEVLVHTGQHYDYAMSQVFFDELGISTPKHNLEIAGGGHGQMTGRMLEAVEPVIVEEEPDWVVVYGDTNSTLAGGLAAAKMHIPVAHVEAGLRSFNRKMPEEINRVLTDHLSKLLLCTGQRAVDNLVNEGITDGIHVIGDVMADAAANAAEIVGRFPDRYLPRVENFDLSAPFDVLRLHRAENTDHPERLAAIINALERSRCPLVFPIHPRTSKKIADAGLRLGGNIFAIPPVSYFLRWYRCWRIAGAW